MSLRTIDPKILEVFLRLLDETHDVFIVFDTSWTVVYANKKAHGYFNIDKDFAGRNFLEQFPSFRGSELSKRMEQAIVSRKPTEFEAFSPVSKRWMQYRVYPLDGILAVYATDINLRKEAQRTIQQNQERYFNFIAQSTEGIWRYEVEEPVPIDLPVEEQIEQMYLNGYLAECNDAMARMYGFSNAYDIMGSRLDMLLVRNEENLAYLQAFIESGYKLYDAESKEVAKDGSTKYLLNNLMGIVENGKLSRAWGTQRDITPIKEVEEKLKDARTQLNLALSSGSAGTFVWNIRTNEVEWTREEEALYGLPEGGFGGRLDNWSQSVHPEDRAAALAALDKAIANKTELDIEFRIVWPDQSIHWILAKGKTIYDDQGAPEKMIGINIDITARKTAPGQDS
jgi:PAS domain S-box-containing protein